MNPGPQKPRILRPPALSRPGGMVARGTLATPTTPVAQVAPVGKMGLLISLGFHACLIAAACSITFIKPEEKGSGDAETAGDRGDFEMPISRREPQVSEPDLPAALPTPQLPAPQVSLVALNQLTALSELPAFEPIAAVIADPPSTPASPPSTGDSTNKSSSPSRIRAGKTGGKTGGKKGSGEGKRTKQATPVTPPQLLSSPPPRYPAEARAAKKTGKVGVLVRVRANGAAASTSVYRSSGNPQLDQAAVTAARSWKFSQTPSLEAGATIAVVVQVTFSL